MQKVLVIGGAGYVGSQLVPALLKSDFYVRVLDTFWYGSKHLEDLRDAKLELVHADMRDVNKVSDALKGIDVVIHLACISNDPSFDLDPKLGKSINLDSFRPIINLLNTSDVKRFIYASSSSVYGISEEERVTEELELTPLTDYSKFKAECEQIQLNELRSDICSTVIRPATVCGFSTRQRFDLVVNILTASAIINREVRVFGGSQYRPNLHIEDMVQAYLCILNADSKVVDKEIFNVGSRNLTVREIAESVQSVIDIDIPIQFLETNDLRSYRVDSTKILDRLEFAPKFTIEDAIQDLKLRFSQFDSVNPLVDSRYVNILRMKELKLG